MEPTVETEQKYRSRASHRGKQNPHLARSDKFDWEEPQILVAEKAQALLYTKNNPKDTRHDKKGNYLATLPAINVPAEAYYHNPAGVCTRPKNEAYPVDATNTFCQWTMPQCWDRREDEHIDREPESSNDEIEVEAPWPSAAGVRYGASNYRTNAARKIKMTIPCWKICHLHSTNSPRCSRKAHIESSFTRGSEFGNYVHDTLDDASPNTVQYSSNDNCIHGFGSSAND